jgi:hypothetical protein
MMQNYKVQFCADGEVVETHTIYASSAGAALDDALELNDSDLDKFVDYDEIRILTAYRVAQIQAAQQEETA